ncbi:MAG: aminotransferase class III-fold pyridoxal phosphate-dependent enzyme [Spirochaetota bacterium]
MRAGRNRIDLRRLHSCRRSLADLAGEQYVEAACMAAAFLRGEEACGLLEAAREQVDFYPDAFRERVDGLLESVGTRVCPGFGGSARGAGTRAFNQATSTAMAPLAGMGFIRIGEDGRAYLISKSEHYHGSLGHGFPGFRLIEIARRIGITNVTHNNTRGHITRLLEQRLIAAANGIDPADRKALARVLGSEEPRLLNRVVNLETGSLAVEAAVKMMLARFYRLQPSFPDPPYRGRTPVFLVMADGEEGAGANYHGTTVPAQLMRGMWPGLARELDRRGIFQVRAVRINDPAHFQELVEEHDRGPRKVAGFLHELVLMNYGGVLLGEGFVRAAHDLCRERDIPVLVDEIQSCAWYPGLFLFREYGLRPDFVAVGKGFPGGEYPASRILTTAAMDTLDQFGALVTNGQEELASLAYLVTMEFAGVNAEHTRWIGGYYRSRLEELAARHAVVDRIEGKGHLGAVCFHTAEDAVRFTGGLNRRCIDASAHTYKAKCPPAVLTKIPLVSTAKMVDYLVGAMDRVLSEMSGR